MIVFTSDVSPSSVPSPEESFSVDSGDTSLTAFSISMLPVDAIPVSSAIVLLIAAASFDTDYPASPYSQD